MAGEWQVSWRSTEGAITPRRPVVIPDAAAAEVVVEFSGSQLCGRVLDEEGRPVAFARVRELQGPLFAMAADDGSFTLAGVAAGVHRLQASLRAAAGPVIEVRVEAGRPTPPVTLVIDDRERNVLSIQVIDAAGRPTPSAFVFVQTAGKVMRTLTADASGVATAQFPEGLPDRAAIIASALNSWAFGVFERVAGDGERQNANIRFAATGSMRIESRGLSGTPTIRSPRSGDLSWMMARIGLPLALSPEVPLVIGGLPPGEYEVTLGSATAISAVVAGSTATVILP